MRAGSGQVSHQPWESQHWAGRGFEFTHHDRSGGEGSEASAHRGELGIARSDTADENDGREFETGGTERRARSHDGSDGGECAEFGGVGEKIRVESRPDYSQRESKWRAGLD